MTILSLANEIILIIIECYFHTIVDSCIDKPVAHRQTVREVERSHASAIEQDVLTNIESYPDLFPQMVRIMYNLFTAATTRERDQRLKAFDELEDLRLGRRPSSIVAVDEDQVVFRKRWLESIIIGQDVLYHTVHHFEWEAYGLRY